MALLWRLRLMASAKAMAFVFGLQFSNNWAMKTDTLGAG